MSSASSSLRAIPFFSRAAHAIGSGALRRATRASGPRAARAIGLAPIVAVVAACGVSPPEEDQDASGGTSSATGGSSAATGGATSGGTNAGGTATGGNDPATGGGSPAGGSGGVLTTGGNNNGGASSGGAPSGGTSSAGDGGSGGQSTGGATGSGGGTNGEESRSAGCGTEPTLTSGEHTIDISGTTRDYILDIPQDYDPDTAYTLVFGWHWRGGSMSDVSGGQIIDGPYYGLKDQAGGSAIFVAPDGIDDGWANTNGRDIEFLHGMLDLFQSDLCIDESRLFSLGFSYGGMMSNAVACELSDVFRAIAPMSGALYSGCNEATDHPIAVWWAHGTNDGVVPLSDGQEALEVMLDKNGCGDTTTPVEPSPCVAYEGCAEGYPVHRCEFDGDHTPANSAIQGSSEAIWNFFDQF